MLGSFGAACCLAAVALWSFGDTPSGVDRALQITARFSFLLFWFAYVGTTLYTLFGSSFRTVSRHVRAYGLAFASAHLVHIGLVIWLYHISPKPPVSQNTLLFFGVAVIWVYLLALLSIRRLAAMLGGLWPVLRWVGSEYIALAFLLDFVRHPLDLDGIVGYLPFAIMGLTGTGLRIIAAIVRHVRVVQVNN